MALQAHPFHRAVERAEVAVPVLEVHQSGLARLFPIADRHIEHEILLPGQEGVAHQAGDVVGDGAIHGILEVQHAKLRRRSLSGHRRDHQIARHEVAVHKDFRGGQVARNDQVEGLVQCFALFALQSHAFVLREVPVGKQRQLPAQQRLVVRRQYAGAGGALPGDQRVRGLRVPGCVGLRAVRIDHAHHRLCAQVAEQHEALRLVPGQDARHLESGGFHQPAHVHERRAVFLRGWRVHDDATARSAYPVHPEVAPKARIGRGHAHRIGHQPVHRGLARQPRMKGPGACGIGPDGCGGLRRCGHARVR
ncbi:MAG: hypothetical protein BWX79_01168 [Alphaproteobacteria bacterium ADurb.Bin100]|nr:MAG: hypothetical protein BWX79_01168 [Alphaproteobacteria bacterium ADurb.Bin100]